MLPCILRDVLLAIYPEFLFQLLLWAPCSSYATDDFASVCLELLFEATLTHLLRGDWSTSTNTPPSLFHLTVQAYQEGGTIATTSKQLITD